MARPKALANSGSLFGPKTMSAIATMINNSGNPMLNIGPPTPALYHNYFGYFNGGM
jgi:hypothetical protein